MNLLHFAIGRRRRAFIFARFLAQRAVVRVTAVLTGASGTIGIGSIGCQKSVYDDSPHLECQLSQSEIVRMVTSLMRMVTVGPIAIVQPWIEC